MTPAANNETLLKLSLETAVPLRMMDLEQVGRDAAWDSFQKNRAGWEELIASHADAMLHGGGKPGQAAEVHNALVDAVAHMAVLVPGGVSLFGLHFESRRP